MAKALIATVSRNGSVASDTGIIARIRSVQPIPTVLSALTRSSRYLSTFGWLMRHQFQSAKWQLVGAVACGVAGRLGSILVLMATIKCALWLLKPETMPSLLTTHFPHLIATPAFVMFLICIPSILLMLASLANAIHIRLRIQVAAKCGTTIALEQASKIFRTQATAADAKTLAVKFSSEMTQDWAALHKAQTNLIKAMVAAAAFAMAIALGAAIDPLVTGIVVLIAVSIATALVWRQHESTYILTAEQARLKIRTLDRNDYLISQLSSAIGNGYRGASLETAVARRHADIIAEHWLKDRSDSAASLFLDVGNGVVVLVMLSTLYFRGHSMNATDIAHAVLLMFALRFAMSQARAVSTYAFALSKDYRRLVMLAAPRATGRPFH